MLQPTSISPGRSLSGGSEPQSARRPAAILSIQYLRGVAAMMVVWHHAAGQIPGMSTRVPWVFGTSGVDLFFVISGFIMVVTTAGANVKPLDFWRRRIVRVVPLYWLLTLLMVGVALIAPGLFKTLEVAPDTLLQSLLFIPHFSQSFPGFVWPLLVPGWTLHFEMFFYALFGLALFLPPRFRLLALTSVFIGLIATGVAFGPFQSAAAQTYTHLMLIEFLAGAWIGYGWVAGRCRLAYPVSLLLLVVGSGLLLLRDQPPFGSFTQITGATLVVLGAIHPAFTAWKNRLLAAIGDSSYSLYLTHIFTLGALRLLWAQIFPDPPGAAGTVGFMIASLLVCVCVGWMTFLRVEQPLMKLLSGRDVRRASAVSPYR